MSQNDSSKQRKLNGKRVFYKGGEGSKYWVLSNFGKHLKNVHKLNSRLIANESSDEVNENHGFEDDSLPSDAVVIPLNSAVEKNEENSSGFALECNPTDNNNNNDDKFTLAHNFSIEYIVDDCETSVHTTKFEWFKSHLWPNYFTNKENGRSNIIEQWWHEANVFSTDQRWHETIENRRDCLW